LHALLTGPLAAGVAGAAPLATRFADHFAALSHRSFLASEDWRRHREAVYDRIVANCHTGLGEPAPALPLSRRLAAAPVDNEPARAALAAAITARLGAGSAALAAELANSVMAFLASARAALGLAEASQARLAAVLERAPPSHGLSLDHVNLYNVLLGEDQRSVPYLPAELATLFAVQITVDACQIQIARGPARAPRHSPALMPADPRA
jgi:hypothetical protein